MQCLHNALIRTHHITSRKKVAKLKQAATFHDVFVLLRSGGPPGVMYVEGKEHGVNQWVSDVQVSRYPMAVLIFWRPKLIAVIESAIQRLPAGLADRRRTPREHTRCSAGEAQRPFRKRYCQRLWQSDAAAWCVRLVEGRHGLHWFLR
jgi:hypothetical protein